MTKITINLPETFEFRRGGEVFQVATGGLSPDIIAQLVMHGATQKIGDAAAGKSGKEATDAMAAVYAALSNGDWGRTRSGSAGEPAINRYIRAIIRGALGDDNKAKLKAIGSDDQDARNAFLWELYESLSEAKQLAVMKAADAAMEIDAKKREAAKNAGGDLGI